MFKNIWDGLIPEVLKNWIICCQFPSFSFLYWGEARVSQCGPGWSRTHEVNQAAPNSEIYLPVTSKCWGYRHEPTHSAQIHLIENFVWLCSAVTSLQLCTERKPFVKSAPLGTLWLEVGIFPGFQQLVSCPDWASSTFLITQSIIGSRPASLWPLSSSSVICAPLLAFQSNLLTTSPAWLPAVERGIWAFRTEGLRR